MKNAIISGVIIGLVSVLWIIGMQSFGYNLQNVEDSQNKWIEYTSVLIPLFGLYFGIRGLKKAQNGKLTFFEGLFEGFKIIAIGGALAAAASFIYIYLFAKNLTVDYMERIFGAMVISLLFTLAISLFLMNGEKEKKY